MKETVISRDGVRLVGMDGTYTYTDEYGVLWTVSKRGSNRYPWRIEGSGESKYFSYAATLALAAETINVRIGIDNAPPKAAP